MFVFLLDTDNSKDIMGKAKKQQGKAMTAKSPTRSPPKGGLASASKSIKASPPKPSPTPTPSKSPAKSPKRKPSSGNTVDCETMPPTNLKFAKKSAPPVLTTVVVVHNTIKRDATFPTTSALNSIKDKEKEIRAPAPTLVQVVPPDEKSAVAKASFTSIAKAVTLKQPIKVST